MTANICTPHGVEVVSDAEFFQRVFGHAPRSREQREADDAAFYAKRREQNRRELEAIRDRLCKQASPELAAKFRAKWAEEDAAVERRETQRKAA